MKRTHCRPFRRWGSRPALRRHSRQRQQAQRRPPQPSPYPPASACKEASWYSEQVRVAGRLFTPTAPADGAARPAVVLAPAWKATAESLDAYAIALAQQGIVALSIDYRGWGAFGAELYLGQRVDTYDKMRFSEQTPEIVFRRGRLDPEHQVQDIRNAITFLQSRTRASTAPASACWASTSAGGHVISVMGMDARAKAGVAVTPDDLRAGRAEDILHSGHGDARQDDQARPRGRAAEDG